MRLTFNNVNRSTRINEAMDLVANKIHKKLAPKYSNLKVNKENDNHPMGGDTYSVRSDDFRLNLRVFLDDGEAVIRGTGTGRPGNISDEITFKSGNPDDLAREVDEYIKNYVLK